LAAIHVSSLFENQRVEIDKAQYRSCVFRRCEIVYSGGPFAFPECTFDQCAWSFVGEAERTLALIVILSRSDPGLARHFGQMLGVIHEYAN